jgi:hypothetical protein
LTEHFRQYNEANERDDIDKAKKEAVDIAGILYENLASIEEVLSRLPMDVDRPSKNEISVWADVKKKLRRFSRYDKAGTIEECQGIARSIADTLLEHDNNPEYAANFLYLGRSGC